MAGAAFHRQDVKGAKIGLGGASIASLMGGLDFLAGQSAPALRAPVRFD
jgi:hypothetical protein